jgi:hemerythrin
LHPVKSCNFVKNFSVIINSPPCTRSLILQSHQDIPDGRVRCSRNDVLSHNLSQHKMALIACICEFNNAVGGAEDLKQVRNAFNKLIATAEIHFALEEQFLRNTSLRSYRMHRRSHRLLLRTLRQQHRNFCMSRDRDTAAHLAHSSDSLLVHLVSA